MGKYKICKICHIAFDKKLDVCPSCGKAIIEEGKLINSNAEGNGRKYRSGGDACNYCSHCYGNKDWCPFMD